MRSRTAEATTGHSVVLGGLWSAASRVLPQLYTLVVSVVAARSLGPDDMGQQSFIAFAELSVVMLVTGGLPTSVMRSISELSGRQEIAQVRALLRWAWWVEGAGALVGGALLAAVAVSRGDLRSAWLLAAVVAVMSVLHNVPSAALIGLQRWKQNSWVGIATGALSVAGVIVILRAGGGITGMFAVEAAISVINLAWTTWLGVRAVAGLPTASLDAGVRRAVTRYGLLTSVSILLTFVVWSRSEFFFLERFSSAAEIAQYSIAFGAATALLRVSDAAAGVLTPAVATLFGAGHLDRLQSGTSRAFRLVLQLSLAGTAAGLALGPQLVRTAYGREYEPAATALVLLLVAFPLLPACALAGAIASGLGRVRITLVPALVATAVNLALDAALIPVLASRGAAIANTVGQLVAGVPVLVLVAREVGGIHWAHWSLVRGAVVALVAGVVAHVAGAAVEGGAGLVAGGLAGLVGYGVLALLLRPLPAQDAEWLAGLVHRFGVVPQRAVRRVGRP